MSAAKQSATARNRHEMPRLRLKMVVASRNQHERPWRLERTDAALSAPRRQLYPGCNAPQRLGPARCLVAIVDEYPIFAQINLRIADAARNAVAASSVDPAHLVGFAVDRKQQDFASLPTTAIVLRCVAECDEMGPIVFRGRASVERDGSMEP